MHLPHISSPPSTPYTRSTLQVRQRAYYNDTMSEKAAVLVISACKRKSNDRVLEHSIVCLSLVNTLGPSARMRQRVTVVGSVCLCVCVCYLTSHFSNVCLSHKRYDLPNGQKFRAVLSENAQLQG